MNLIKTSQKFPKIDLEWAKGVEYVKVNMGGQENEIGAKYNVKGYPWINFYRNGKAIQFKGRRHVPKLISFMFQRIKQPFKLITRNRSKIGSGLSLT